MILNKCLSNYHLKTYDKMQMCGGGVLTIMITFIKYLYTNNANSLMNSIKLFVYILRDLGKSTSKKGPPSFRGYISWEPENIFAGSCGLKKYLLSTTIGNSHCLFINLGS